MNSKLSRFFRSAQYVAVLPLFAAACDEPEEAPSPEELGVSLDDAPAASATIAVEADMPIDPDLMLFDERMLAIAGEVPQFGGLFVRLDENEEEELYVRLTDEDPAVLERVEAAIERMFPGSIPEDGFHVVRSEYGFAELKLTQQRLNKYLGTLPGLVSTDVDELTGRVVLGVADDESFARVRAAVAESEVDAAMVELTRRPPVELTALLTSKQTTMTGGISIGNPDGAQCTMGFTGWIEGTRGFVTASHCTKGWGAMNSVVFSQPVNWYAGSRRVGQEFKDPPFFPCTYKDKASNTYKNAAQCRYSDAAFIKLDDKDPSQTTINIKKGVAWAELGSIYYSTMLPIVSRDEGNDYYNDAFVGQPLQLVGVGSDQDGRKKGTINGMCVDIAHNSGKVFLCNIEADTIGSSPGDSGGPVFRNRPISPPHNYGPTNTLHLMGIVWGAPGRISPFLNIRRELVLHDNPNYIRVCDGNPSSC